jgi:crotonobetainyl-CoA:carnitine CoA-transferase CaiB-like acyl-CoA transferase
VWNCGYDDHTDPPVRGGGNQGFHIGSVWAVMGALTAVVHRQATGVGQHVDVSLHAAANVTTEVGTFEWLVARHTVQRQTGRHASVQPTSDTQVLAADGRYVLLGFPPRAGKDYQAILDWMDDLGIRDDFPEAALLDLAVERGGVQIVELGQDPIADEVWNAGRAAMAFIASRTDAYEFFEGSQQRGIVSGIVYAPEEVVADRHFLARRFPVELHHDDIGRAATYPGAPFVMPESPWHLSRRAPHVGEHTDEVIGL